MKVDKKESDKKLRTMATEYERIKYMQHQLIKERQYLFARQRQLTQNSQSGSDDSDVDNDYVDMAMEEDMCVTMDEASEDEGTITDTSDQYNEDNNRGKDVTSTQRIPGVIITVSEEDTSTEKIDETSHTLKSDKIRKTMSKFSSNQSQDNEVKKLRETIQTQETQIAALTKKLTDVQEENEASTQKLKKLLDDAMRKMRRYEVCVDKEEQLEKQKHFLKSQLERSMADRFQAEKKLREENWETRQKLKEVMNRAEWLEHRLNSANRSSTSPEEEDEEMPKITTGGDEMNGVLEHLNVLLSN